MDCSDQVQDLTNGLFDRGQLLCRNHAHPFSQTLFRDSSNLVDHCVHGAPCGDDRDQKGRAGFGRAG